MLSIGKLLAALACASAFEAGLAQTGPSTILEVQLENCVSYVGDVSDSSRFASDPNRTPAPAGLRNFGTTLFLADIVSVNGRPAKGVAVISLRTINLRASPTPGQAIADTVRNSISDYALEILHTDGTPIGSIYASGLSGGAAPPGAPLAAAASSNAVLGGTGAFLGVRGQLGGGPMPVPVRSASVTEDPLNRRIHGGGRFSILVHLIPLERPEIVNTAMGPAIFHGDFSPVTAEKPARPGELLIMSVSSLGPVTPNLDPGQPFPAYQDGNVHVVNSPVEVTVNGKSATVVNKIGWPRLKNIYRVDFVVPDDAGAGMATLGVSAAWIAGTEVRFAVR